MNNLRILTINNVKLSRYCFYMNPNMKLNFQICINVPLSLSIKYGQKLLHITKKVATYALRTASKRAIQKVQIKFQRRLRKLLQRVPVRVQVNCLCQQIKYQYNQLEYQKRITYQQNEDSKLLVNLDYHN